MLFYSLFAINVVLLGWYLAYMFKSKLKHYGLSIAIRIVTLLMFGLVIFEQFSEKQHLIIVLMIWVIFEGAEYLHKPKSSKST